MCTKKKRKTSKREKSQYSNPSRWLAAGRGGLERKILILLSGMMTRMDDPDETLVRVILMKLFEVLVNVIKENN
jgi:hypothetical protein